MAASAYVEGIEVTQGIQHYQSAMHLFDPADRGPDNSLTLIAGRPAWVRAYMRSTGPDMVHGVGARVTLSRPGQPDEVFEPAAPGVVTAHPRYDTQPTPIIAEDVFQRSQRADIGSTVNVVIPGEEMCGRLSIRVEALADGQVVHERTTLVDATLHQRLHLRAIMVGFSGTDPGTGDAVLVPPPGLHDLMATSGTALAMLPVAGAAEYSVAGTLMLSTPLGTNGCGPGDPGWKALMAELDTIALNDTGHGPWPGTIYYGLIAQDVPDPTFSTTGGGGCGFAGATGDYGVAAGFSLTPDLGRHRGADMVMAHEIGHAMGRAHVRGCGYPDSQLGGIDQAYPAYEPYSWPDAPGASIGEYGLDPRIGEVLAPDLYKDLMSYCPPPSTPPGAVRKWISIHGHRQAAPHPALRPREVCLPGFEHEPVVDHDPNVYIPDPTGHLGRVTRQSVIHVLGRIGPDLAFRPDGVVRGWATRSTGGPPSGWTLLLETTDGRVLGRVPMHVVTVASCGTCGGCEGRSAAPDGSVLHGVVPGTRDGLVLRVVDPEGETTWHREAADRPPHVQLRRADVDDEGLHVTWEVDAVRPDETTVDVQWSTDGDRWQSAAASGGDGAALVDPATMSPGRVHVRVVAQDGFWRAPSNDRAVAIPERPPVLAILWPPSGAVLAAGRPLRLWAAVRHDAGTADLDVAWTLDGQPAGDGQDVWTVVPAPGDHEAAVRVTDASGATVESGVTFTTEEGPSSPT